MRKSSAPFRTFIMPAVAGSISLFALNVHGIAQGNRAPIAGADTILTRSTGQPVKLSNLLQNDSDPDGDSIGISGVSAGTGGSVSLDPETPNLVAFKPSRSFDGNGTFTYQLTDSRGASSQGVVNVRNPFLQGKGLYAGPITGNPGVPNSVGYLQVSLSSSGAATVQLRFGT
ncbi:MAG: hypothetical protein EOP84_35995, partial [Verrucomicrobiaceae bacterium]